MKVKEFIKKLKSFDPEMEVTVSDGFNYCFYCTNEKYDYVFNEFDGKVDIGVGGMEEEHEG